MKKRLLFAAMAMLTSVSSFALEADEFVYTPQGRFLITGANLNANNAFQDMTGWTVIGADKTLEDKFITNADGYAAGINSVQSVDATTGEGMYFKFEPTDKGATYVVSFKMKGAALDNTKIKIPGDANKRENNLVKVAGSTFNTYSYPATDDEVVVNTAEELTEAWQTFNYAIQGDGITARTWFISFTTMATTIEIADLQIAPAIQVADLRSRDAMLERLNAYKNCYDWDTAILDDLGYNEIIESLEGVGDETGQAELDELLGTADEILDEFFKANMDDYLATSDSYIATTNGAGSPKVDNKFNTWLAKVQKALTWGDWNCLPSGRGFWEKEEQGAADLGHYAGGNTWGYGAPDTPMGVYTQKTLDAGSYVFGIEGRAAVRDEASSGSWTNNDGLDVAYGIAYIVKIENEVATDTIVSIVKDLDAVNYNPFFIVAKISESGLYEIGFKSYCKEDYKNLKNGSVTYIKNASLYGKNDNRYNQKQLAYEANVRAQITAGRDNLTTAAGYLADDSYYWGKTDLETVVNEIEPLIAAYEAMSQDAIIETYDESVYEAGPTNENGLLEHEVYDTATKFIIDGNRTFISRNDKLNSLQTAIDNATTILKMRVYDAATGKGELEAAIANAKDIQTQMKASDYSDENVAIVDEAIADLATAVEEFKSTIPASSITEIIAVDFENGAAFNSESGLYESQGVNTVMAIENFSEATPTTDDKGVGEMIFEIGIDSNGEKLLPGVLRIGSGSAYAAIPAKEYGTNILKLSMDFWFVRLTDGHVGFNLTDENDERVAGLYFVPYNNNLGSAGYDDFAIANIGAYFPSNTAGDAASCADNNLSHIECIFDYGEQTMYLTSTNPNGTFATDKVAFNCKVPTKFTVLSNYKNYPGRRCWFDNLRIEQIAAGAPAGVATIKADAQNAAAVYNLAGQRLTSAPAKGLYIQGGKKYVVK